MTKVTSKREIETATENIADSRQNDDSAHDAVNGVTLAFEARYFLNVFTGQSDSSLKISTVCRIVQNLIFV